MKNFAHLRTDYKGDFFNEDEVDKNPIIQFENWFQDAIKIPDISFNAFTLSTLDSKGFPDSRIVLLKNVSDAGFTFFTNYNSAKGKQLEDNPKASMVFFWDQLKRQVRIQGTVSKVSPEQSDDYFINRPAGSKLGAWASPQSQVLESREELEALLSKTREKYGENPTERPEFWGGYILKPLQIEFWQGRESRLHDRLKYTLQESGEWKIERLAP